MTIPEEIEQLKIKLGETDDERKQAELLLEILYKYASINSADAEPYIDRLLQSAERLNETLYKAWGLYYLAVLREIKGEYNYAIDLGQQAISLFEQIKDRKGIAISYHHIGSVYEKQGKYPEALKNHFVALKLIEELGDKQSKAASYNNIGVIYFRQCNYTEALKNHFAALKINEELQNKSWLFKNYTNIGTVYKNQGNYPEALKNFLVALKITVEIGNKFGIAGSYNSIGNIYSVLGNYPEELKNHIASLKISEEIGDKSGISTSYNNIGSAYNRHGNYPDALINYLVSMKIREGIGDKRGIAMSYLNIGTVYEKQGNYPEALKNHFTALKLWKEIGDKQGIAVCNNNIGHVYERQGNYKEALKNQLLANKIAEEINAKEEIKDSCLSLSRVYRATNDFGNALKSFEKYHETEKEMLGEQTQKQLTNLNFMHNMEQKEKDLEIEQLRNVELKKERDRSEALLLNILPAEVAEELKAKGSADAKQFDDVTVMFTDFKNFTQISEKLSPSELVAEIHTCFKEFDNIITKHNIEKIKTIGDSYMCAGGLPVANITNAIEVVNAALEIRQFMQQHLEQRKKDGKEPFEMRIGIHTGPVVAGIVGIKKFAYDIWGDTVNVASRMESSGEAGKVNISGSTYELVKDKFNCIHRGKIQAKNKGEIDMYFVE